MIKEYQYTNIRRVLDELHRHPLLNDLTLEQKILETDTDYPKFNDYWHDKVMLYAEVAKQADCPLNELDNIMNESFENFFLLPVFISSVFVN